MKKILITGASRGIGHALALEFAAQGHQVLAVSRNSVALNSLAVHPNIDVLGFDLADLPTCSLSEIVATKLGGLDVLINNAGFLLHKPFVEFSLADINQIMYTNTIAPGLLIGQVMRLLLGAPDAHVVNISSMGGFQGSAKFEGLSWYSASKAALACLTEVLAQEYANTSVRFNALALGAVQTQMLQEAFPGYQAPLSSQEMASFIADFALNGHRFFNGKILPVSVSTP
jgi:NAD(P)-dependent dehydrogenase (short-subunit alcohol dehydrogenase family)